MIELIIIIVILGILAAIAIPKYIDMKSEANKAVAKGVIGALSGADNILFANYLLYGTTYDNANILSNAAVSQGLRYHGAPRVPWSWAGPTIPLRIRSIPPPLRGGTRPVFRDRLERRRTGIATVSSLPERGNGHSPFSFFL